LEFLENKERKDGAILLVLQECRIFIFGHSLFALPAPVKNLYSLGLLMIKKVD
jgi:hypothetical protein